MTLRTEQVGDDPDAPLWRVENDVFAMVFLPSAGGRLLSLQVAGRELLWVNPQLFDEKFRTLRPRSSWPDIDGTFTTWTNVGGSKTWPAPQGWSGAGEWPGPPDEVLDAGSYSFSSRTNDDLTELTITLESEDDPRTGLRIRRAFTVTPASASFVQRNTFVNTSPDVVTWSIWEVIQVATHGGAMKPIEHTAIVIDGTRRDAIVDLGRYEGAPVVVDTPAGCAVAISPTVSKLGFPDAAGRIAYRSQAAPGLAISFDIDPSAEYPDEGSRAEVWLQYPLTAPLSNPAGLWPDVWLAELEVLSPLRHIAPGAEVSMTLTWTVEH